MESVIKWQTGVPKKKGRYLLSTRDGKIDIDNWSIYTNNWYHYANFFVLAWCPLSKIKPYKE